MDSRVNSSKKIYLECLRLLSLFGVLYCHTGKRGLLLYEVTTNPITYYFSKTMLLFSQICVPVFFMISGSLLLGRQEDLKKHLRHRVLKYVVILCVVVFLQYLYNCLGNPALCLWYPELQGEYPATAFSVWELCRKIYSGGAMTQHWFLYAYVSFLLILPFLRKMVSGISKEYIWYFLAMAFLGWAVFPFVERWQHFPASTLELPLIKNIIFYPLLGYFCEREEFFGKGKVILAMLMGALAWTGFNIVLMENGKMLFEEFNVFFFSLVLFVSVKYLFEKKPSPKWLGNFYVFCGRGVFGTYLLEYVLRYFCDPVYQLACGLGEIPALFLWLFCVMAIGILLVNGLRCIPIVGEIFGGTKKGLAFPGKSS